MRSHVSVPVEQLLGFVSADIVMVSPWTRRWIHYACAPDTKRQARGRVFVRRAWHNKEQQNNERMPMNHSAISSFIWGTADLLRNSFKQHQYGDIILPFTVMRRIEGVLQ